MTVNYHIRGRIIQVPSNYDPEKRTYSGIWDGSLKPAYGNNWHTQLSVGTMLTHPRYGMGRKRLGAADVDKWALRNHRAVLLRPDGPGWFSGGPSRG